MAPPPASKSNKIGPIRNLATQPPLNIENLPSRIQNGECKVLPPRFEAPTAIVPSSCMPAPNCCPPFPYCPPCTPYPPMCVPPSPMFCGPCPPCAPVNICQPTYCPPYPCMPPPPPSCCPPPCCPPPCCPPTACCPPPNCCPPKNCCPQPNCCPPPNCCCGPKVTVCCPSPCPPPCPPPCCPQEEQSCCPRPPKSNKCRGSGAKQVICIPRGLKKPIGVSTLPTQNVNGGCGGGGGGGMNAAPVPNAGDQPASYNNCNFYLTQMPKGLETQFGGGGGMMGGNNNGMCMGMGMPLPPPPEEECCFDEGPGSNEYMNNGEEEECEEEEAPQDDDEECIEDEEDDNSGSKNRSSSHQRKYSSFNTRSTKSFRGNAGDDKIFHPPQGYHGSRRTKWGDKPCSSGRFPPINQCPPNNCLPPGGAMMGGGACCPPRNMGMGGMGCPPGLTGGINCIPGMGGVYGPVTGPGCYRRGGLKTGLQNCQRSCHPISTGRSVSRRQTSTGSYGRNSGSGKGSHDTGDYHRAPTAGHDQGNNTRAESRQHDSNRGSGGSGHKNSRSSGRSNTARGFGGAGESVAARQRWSGESRQGVKKKEQGVGTDRLKLHTALYRNYLYDEDELTTKSKAYHPDKYPIPPPHTKDKMVHAGRAPTVLYRENDSCMDFSQTEGPSRASSRGHRSRSNSRLKGNKNASSQFDYQANYATVHNKPRTHTDTTQTRGAPPPIPPRSHTPHPQHPPPPVPPRGRRPFFPSADGNGNRSLHTSTRKITSEPDVRHHTCGRYESNKPHFSTNAATNINRPSSRTRTVTIGQTRAATQTLPSERLEKRRHWSNTASDSKIPQKHVHKTESRRRFQRTEPQRQVDRSESYMNIQNDNWQRENVEDVNVNDNCAPAKHTCIQYNTRRLHRLCSFTNQREKRLSDIPHTCRFKEPKCPIRETIASILRKKPALNCKWHDRDVPEFHEFCMTDHNRQANRHQLITKPSSRNISGESSARGIEQRGAKRRNDQRY